MEQKRPYWKVAVSLASSLVATVLVVVIGVKLLGFFLPFVIGWCIALIAHPLVCWLEKRLKIRKKLGSAITIILVLAAIIFAIYYAGSKIGAEVGRFLNEVPDLYQDAEAGFAEIGSTLNGFFRRLPQGIQSGWRNMVLNLDQTAADLIGRLGEPTVEAAGNVAKKLPSLLISTIVTIVSAYFFIAERDEVIRRFMQIAPISIRKRMSLVSQNFKVAVGGYMKAQFKIMCVVAVILLIGLNILGVNYTILLSILISFVDMLPFFGTGTVMIPWGVYKLLTGNVRMAVGLLILYAVTQVIRQVIQPKLVGDSMGLDPLVTLVLLFIGYKVGSVLGLLLAVPIGMIVINMVKAGAFDYIIDDAKILAEGLLSLRE
ncbi:MAG TPA: sporulation integral membrane protein YtvI [Lachnospiraceae bacterium]|nr:sporulation integral membrane protein YtvI [Lachnospiraceae bacterium]